MDDGETVEGAGEHHIQHAAGGAALLRREGYGIEHAPAAEIPGFRVFAGGDKIQAGEIRRHGFCG